MYRGDSHQAGTGSRCAARSNRTRELSEIWEKLQKLYLEERNMSAVLLLLDPGICWVSAGNKQAARGIAEVQKLLEEERNRYPKGLPIVQCHCQTDWISPGHFLLSGGLTLRRNNGKTASLYATAFCREEQGRILIAHLRYSQSDRAQDLEADKGMKWNTEYQAGLERRLRELERYQLVMEQSEDIVFAWDLVQDTLQISPNWEKKFGYPLASDTVSRQLAQSSYIHPDDLSQAVEVYKRLREGTPYLETELRIFKADGAYLWCRIRISLVLEEGKPVRAAGVLFDIDREKRAEQQLMNRAERDALTGLYNRGASQSLTEAVLSGAGAAIQTLMIIDVDNFKTINDQFGHLRGDIVLSEVAGKLRGLFRDTDIVGRIGGDEFLVFMKNSGNPRVIEKKAREILQNISKCAAAHQGDPVISCSIGIAVSPKDGIDFKEIYQNADTALYQAKRSGKNQYAFYDRKAMGHSEALSAGSEVSMSIDSELRDKPEWEQAASCVSQILSQSSSPEEAAQIMMKTLGKQLQVTRMALYLFEPKGKAGFYQKTAQWGSGGEPLAYDAGRDLDFQDLQEIGSRLESGCKILSCKKIQGAPLQIWPVQDGQAEGDRLFFPIRGGKQLPLLGMASFDHSQGTWKGTQITCLEAAADIAGPSLLKEYIQKKTAQDAARMRAVLDALKLRIYVVDPNTWEVLFANRQALSSAMGTEGACYQWLFHRSAPCGHCPLLPQNRGKDPEDSVEVVPIPWTDCSEAGVMIWKGRDEGNTSA